MQESNWLRKWNATSLKWQQPSKYQALLMPLANWDERCTPSEDGPNHPCLHLRIRLHLFLIECLAVALLLQLALFERTLAENRIQHCPRINSFCTLLL